MEENIDNIFSLLYPNFQEILTNIENIYTKDSGYYVFKRKKHDSTHYYAYLKANKGSANNESLTYPAFPKYLLPPKPIFDELNKSPKLSFDEGFRLSNWNDVIGDFYCDIEDIEVKSKKYSTNVEKITKYLNEQKKNNDEYIYSVYVIDKINKYKYYCCHLNEITQKMDGVYSVKSDKYTQNLQPYTVEFNLENNNIKQI